VLDLGGVDTGVGNVTQVKAGIADAVVDRILTSGSRLSANVTFQLSTVTAWSQYSHLVADDSNFVLVNLHGQYLPVPAGYNSSVWLNTVLNAISVRSVAWVHLGGYPLHWAWAEDGSNVDLGSQGFQLLAETGLWTNAVIGPPNPGWSVAALDPVFCCGSSPWLDNSWLNNKVPYSGDIAYAKLGNYSLITQQGTFGFYPYLYEVADNTHRLYSAGGNGFIYGSNLQSVGSFVDFDPAALLTTDNTISRIPLDYAKGFLGTLLALYPLIANPLYEMNSASQQISNERSSGKTSGLDTAQNLFAQSMSEYQAGHQFPSLVLAEQAYSAAQEATTPFLTQAYPYLALFGGIVGIALIFTLVRMGPFLVSAGMSISLPRFRRKKPKQKKPPAQQEPSNV
jgi:hypothetical protein